jgi:CheY-like chemotaxis protein
MRRPLRQFRHERDVAEGASRARADALPDCRRHHWLRVETNNQDFPNSAREPFAPELALAGHPARLCAPIKDGAAVAEGCRFRQNMGDNHRRHAPHVQETRPAHRRLLPHRRSGYSRRSRAVFHAMRQAAHLDPLRYQEIRFAIGFGDLFRCYDHNRSRSRVDGAREAHDSTSVARQSRVRSPVWVDHGRLPMPQGSSLYGRVVLIVERSWVIGSAIAHALEAKGAQVLLANNSRSALPLIDHPHLAAAILDGGSNFLCRRLQARGIPFLFYTGRNRTHEQWATAPIVQKPAPPAEVVKEVERLLARNH